MEHALPSEVSGNEPPRGAASPVTPSRLRSNSRSTALSSTAAKANYTEAVEMVNELAPANRHGGLDRFENAILEEIEELRESAGTAAPESTSGKGSADRGQGSADHLPLYTSPPQPKAHSTLPSREFCRALLQLGLLLGRELCGGLILLAASIAVILVEAPSRIDKRCITLSNCTGYAPLAAEPDEPAGFQWPFGADDGEAGSQGPDAFDADDEFRLISELLLWMLRPLYSLAAARAASLFVWGVLSSPALQRFMPGILLLLIRSALSCPLCVPAMLFPVSNAVFRILYFDRTAWKNLFGLPSFVPASTWMLVAALAFVLIDAAVQFSQNQLTLRHYEDRSQSAFDQQQALRKIAAAARSAERRRVHRHGPYTKAPLDHGDSRRKLARPGHLSKLQEQLQRLAGPLDIGADLTEAGSLAQARRRALRLFKLILKEEALVTTASGRGSLISEAPEPAVDRETLLRWAFEGARSPPPKLAAALFSYGPWVTQDAFVQAVERSYKEQRLLTASVANFDRLQVILLRGLQCIWAFIFLVLLLRLPFIDVNLVSMLIPLTSALLIFFTLAGGVCAEVFTSFFFTYVTRPYDIGERVYVATPGSSPALSSLIVKDVEVLRTHFLTANGEAMVVSNSSVKNMALTNLSRSGKLTLLVQLMVPAATQSSKINELLDAIATFAVESGEWSECENQFGEAALDKGHLLLNIWPTSVLAAHDIMGVYGAKSRLLLFAHAYMQAAKIEYVLPVQPLRESAAPRTGFGGVVEQALSAAAVEKLTKKGSAAGSNFPFGVARGARS